MDTTQSRKFRAKPDGAFPKAFPDKPFDKLKACRGHPRMGPMFLPVYQGGRLLFAPHPEIAS